MIKKQPQRRYCTCCNTKQYTDKMQYVYYKLLRKWAWHCNNCLSAIQDNLQFVPGYKQKYLMELFSGSKTVSTIAESKYQYKTFSVDIEEKFQPALCKDIMKIKLADIPDSKRIFFVWASIPCLPYTVLNIKRYWHKITYSHRYYYYFPKINEAKEAIQLLEKTLWLIKTINPVYYIIENPRGGMRHMPQMNFAPFRYTVSYNDFDSDVYKPTDLFTNCNFLRFPQLRSSVGRKFAASITKMKDSYERSIVPPGLVTEILKQIENVHFKP